MKRADLVRDDHPPLFTSEQEAAFKARFLRGPFDCCWLWKGSLSPTGYGRLTLQVVGKRQQLQAHRMAWFLEGRSIAAGMELDHQCNNRSCVNPNHLREVTPSQNSRRSSNMGGLHAAQTHCKFGHEFTPENTNSYRHPGHGRMLRKCRECSRQSGRTQRARAIVDAALGVK